MLLLEDVRTAQARLHQEKLAAMGRVSAGIAHEIRNPLAAIAQANALLLEDALPEPQQRLARMVADNVERLKRIVDEVMESRPGHARLNAAWSMPPPRWPRPRPNGRARPGWTPGPAACCTWTCRRSRCAWSSTASTCVACSSTCSTTPSATAAARPGAVGRAPGGARRRQRAAARGQRRAGHHRRRSSATCSSRSSRRAVAAPDWACIFAASCANATARASNTGCGPTASATCSS